MRRFLCLCLPPRRPLVPRTNVVIRDLDDVDELLFSATGGRATRKPEGLRVRFAAGVSSFNVLSFLRFDMRGLGRAWKGRTRVHDKRKKRMKT